MNRNQFDLALELLRPTDWSLFESLSSSFLASEYPDLRTMANPSGDGGRDSELFCRSSTQFVAFQYSVASDWKSKINHTKKRLQTTFPGVRIIIYLTNQQIGAKADSLKSDFQSKGYALDIRDRSWFLERYIEDDTKTIASNELVEKVAKPYLEGSQVIESKSYSLSTQEAKAALLYLGLQWQDDISQKGLTKLSFEAIVRSVLRNSNSEVRLSRQEIYNRIYDFLPSTAKDQVKRNIDSALTSLTKRYIRHWKKEDEFCLTYKESERLKRRLADRELEDREFEKEIKINCELCLAELCKYKTEDIDELTVRVKRILNVFLLDRGEIFASEVETGNLANIGFEKLNDIILNDINRIRSSEHLMHFLPTMVSTIITTLLTQSTEITQTYLKCLSDSYTLFAFLKEVPDVQACTKKIFSHGVIWLDTTVLLPVFAEVLFELDNEKRFTNLFKAASKAGMSLKMTPGVVKEIFAHMRISETCSRYKIAEWRGRIPYLYSNYMQLGHSPNAFSAWLEFFRGHERPEDDIADYLENEFNIKREELHIQNTHVSDELRCAVESLWEEAHKKRRKKGESTYDMDTTKKLIEHDVENYLGVISLRHTEQVSEFGFKNWWLTIDTIAWQIRDEIKKEFQKDVPPSPLLSLDYLINNIAFGPSREHMAREEEQNLPVILDPNFSEFMPKEIGDIAEKVREENKDFPDYVIRRKVRDECDRAKRKYGCLTKQAVTEGYFTE